MNEQCVIPAATLCWGLGGASLFLDRDVRLEHNAEMSATVAEVHGNMLGTVQKMRLSKRRIWDVRKTA